MLAWPPNARTTVGRTGSSLWHVPEGRWAFNESVTQVFDDMLHRSIPQNDAMRRAVFNVCRKFVQPGTDIVDLGCSCGEAVAPFVVQRIRACSHCTTTPLMSRIGSTPGCDGLGVAGDMIDCRREPDPF